MSGNWIWKTNLLKYYLWLDIQVILIQQINRLQVNCSTVEVYLENIYMCKNEEIFLELNV